jgi:hypothetical protein
MVSLWRSRQLRNDYERISKDFVMPEGQDPIVLFFAQQEPEATVLVAGGAFQSNYEAVTFLRSLLPSNVRILYKEAISSFLHYDPVGKGTEPENKPLNLYRLLSKDPNLFFVPLDADKSELFNSVDGVVSIGGTASFEAALLGIPSMAFSRPWYMASGLVETFEDSTNFVSAVCNKKRESPNLDAWVEFLYGYLFLSVETKFAGIDPKVDRDGKAFECALRYFGVYLKKTLRSQPSPPEGVDFCK